MATKTIDIGNQKIQIRALKWGEKRKLKEEGYDLSGLEKSSESDAMIEKVVELSCGNTAILDEMETFEVYNLWNAIMRFSYFGDEEEVKN